MDAPFLYRRRPPRGYEQRNQHVLPSLNPVTQTFPIFTSNLGIPSLVKCVYRDYSLFDQQFSSCITETQLCYITTLAFVNRCMTAQLFVRDANTHELERVANPLMLPSVLADYIESIGLVMLPAGIIVSPLITQDESWLRHELITHPDHYLVLEEVATTPTTWGIHIPWIEIYNGMVDKLDPLVQSTFRRVTSLRSGSLEMLVSIRKLEENSWQALSPVKMSLHQALRSGCRQYRDVADASRWPGFHNELLHECFRSQPYDPELVMTHEVLSSLLG